jgi:hypothetical protein
VAGGEDELDGVAADGSHAKDFAAKEPSPARKALVRFETQDFFE